MVELFPQRTVKILTPDTSECDLIQNRVITDVIS